MANSTALFGSSRSRGCLLLLVAGFAMCVLLLQLRRGDVNRHRTVAAETPWPVFTRPVDPIFKVRGKDLDTYRCRFSGDTVLPATRSQPAPAAIVSLFSSSSPSYKNYIAGLEVLGTSIQAHSSGSAAHVQRVVMILQGSQCDATCLRRLRDTGWKVCYAPKISPPSPSSVDRFRDQFVKLALWNMLEFRRVVYLDSDTLAVGKLDRLLATPVGSAHPLAAAQDISGGKWVDGFNMGVAVIHPNASEFIRLFDLMAQNKVRYNTVMSEQGFLSVVYRNRWLKLRFEDNANLAAYTDDNKLWKEKEAGICLIHFTMQKGWEIGEGSAYINQGKLWRAEWQKMCSRRCSASGDCALAGAVDCKCKTVPNSPCPG